MTRADVLCEAVAMSRRLLPAFLDGFTDENRTAQAPGLPNHAAWTLGHAAAELHALAHRLDGRPEFPEDDFATSEAPPAGRFRAADVAEGSTPVADPDRYPPLDRCRAIYERACDRALAAIRTADDADLDRAVAWGDADHPVFRCVLSALFHTGYHAGQLADLRRGLGMPRLFGP